MYGADWQEIGEATSNKTSTKDERTSDKDKTKTILKLYAFNAATPIFFALPDLDTMSSAATNQVVTLLFG